MQKTKECGCRQILEHPIQIEVINLKRQSVRRNIDNWEWESKWAGNPLNGKKISYEDTAIVIGNEENLSDGEVVYYAGDPALPSGVEKPDSISEAYQEEMGGQMVLYGL